MAFNKRPVIKLTEVKKLAALHCSQEEIAAYLGIGLSILRKVIQNDQRVAECIREGQATGKISLRRKQFSLAGHNAAMAIHLGKQLLDQTDKSALTVSGPDGGPVETLDYSKLTLDERTALRKALTKAIQSP